MLFIRNMFWPLVYVWMTVWESFGFEHKRHRLRIWHFFLKFHRFHWFFYILVLITVKSLKISFGWRKIMITHIWLRNIFMCEKCERRKKWDETKKLMEMKEKWWENLEGKTKKRDIHTVWKPAFMERDRKWKRKCPEKSQRMGMRKWSRTNECNGIMPVFSHSVRIF